MTKIVYVDPNISPEVWILPRCVIALPISEHPTIKAERVIERMPDGEKRRPLHDRVFAILEYLRAHSPADANTIAADTGFRWESVKVILLSHPELFQRAGKVKNGANARNLWALTDPDQVPG